MKTVNVEDDTWETLILLKVKKKAASMDELIKSLVVNQKEV